MDAVSSVGRNPSSPGTEVARSSAIAGWHTGAAWKALSPSLQEVLRTPRFTQRVLWLSSTTSIAMYGFVAWMRRDLPICRPLPALGEVACYVAAIGAAVGFLLYRRRMFSADHLTSLFRKDADPIALSTDPRTRVVNEQLRRKIEMLGPFERHFLSTFTAMQAPMVVSLALSTVIALAGLILAFSKRDPILYLPFALVSASLNCLVWPSANRLEGVLQEIRPQLGDA